MEITIDNTILLVAATGSAYVYDLRSSSCVGIFDLRSAAVQSMEWFVMPNALGEEEFAVVLGNELVKYSVTAFSESAGKQTLQLGQSKNITSADEDEAIDRVLYDTESRAVILETRRTIGFEPHVTLALFQMPTSSGSDAINATRAEVRPFATKLSSQSAHLIGIFKEGKEMSSLCLNREPWIVSWRLRTLLRWRDRSG